MHLPIRMIDNKKVTCVDVTNNMIRIVYAVLHKIIAAEFNITTTYKETINSLRYNKCSEIFTSKPIESFDETLIEGWSSTVVLNIDKCAVCYEFTASRTSCDHYVCGICFDSLKKIECPICRNNFMSDEETDELIEYVEE